jgi:ribosomal protein L11 methyltransferase
VVQEPCTREEAWTRWEEARARGATGAVTSWGSGIHGRENLRTFWELHEVDQVPEGEDLVEENWTPFWRETLAVVRVTERIALVPAWEEVPEGLAVPIRIDPGMAFGAGDHPTTRLCLRILEKLAVAGKLPARVLDVGAGTGVLSLAAECLGAGQVDALDIDPFGYAACRRNIRLNDLEQAVRPLLLSLDLLDVSYPLLLANIAAGQLEALASLLVRRLETAGRMILSGFEVHREAGVREALGVAIEERLEEDGWVALLARAP